VVIAHKHTPFTKAIDKTRRKKKECGSGYQTRINALLRADRESHRPPEQVPGIRERLIPSATCPKDELLSIIFP